MLWHAPAPTERTNERPPTLSGYPIMLGRPPFLNDAAATAAKGFWLLHLQKRGGGENYFFGLEEGSSAREGGREHLHPRVGRGGGGRRTAAAGLNNGQQSPPPGWLFRFPRGRRDFQVNCLHLPPSPPKPFSTLFCLFHNPCRHKERGRLGGWPPSNLLSVANEVHLHCGHISAAALHHSNAFRVNKQQSAAE